MWKLPNLLVILTAVVALPVVIGAIIVLVLWQHLM